LSAPAGITFSRLGEREAAMDFFPEPPPFAEAPAPPAPISSLGTERHIHALSYIP